MPIKFKHLIHDVFYILYFTIMISWWVSIVKSNPYKDEIPVVTKQEVIETVETEIDYSLLYSYKEDVRNDTCLELSVEDATLLMQIARSEGGETLEGQLWVMGTILNRLNSDKFPDSIYEIVSQTNPMQFEVYWTGKYKTADVNVNSHLALAELEKGNNPTMGAIYFEANTNSDNSWHKTKTFIKEVAGNRYYK